MSKSSTISYSLEVFPTINEVANKNFWIAIDKFSQLKPEFYSITANSRSQINFQTMQTGLKISELTNQKVALHMVINDHSSAELRMLAENYWQKGIRKIVALRGDNIDENSQLKYASNLVSLLKDIAPFEVYVAGYPQKHPQATSMEEDITNLKIKVDAGAKMVISQFFFDPQNFLKFRDLAYKKGIKVPIVPGILPIVNYQKLHQFALKCQVKLPKFLDKMFENLQVSDIEHKLLAMNVLSHQITKLIDNGITHFHFYTLNETVLTYQVCRWLQTAF